MRPEPAIESLRAQIEKIEGRSRRVKSVLPFGIAEVDTRLPGGGLALGALHEVAGGGNGAIDGAAAALFAAGIAARTKGKILWVITRPDLFAPALAQAGLAPDRVIYVEAGNDKAVLACVEEGLRHGGLGAVVGEVARLDMTASRRLQLCAEETGTIGIALRRWRRQAEASDFGQPTAAMTRWRISTMPSAPLPVPGVSRHRWLVELIRARAGESADFELEACDDSGRLALPPHLVDRPGAAEGRRRGASG
ncbi:MAG: damage-inducible protein [Mesorhizobium sp.]|uniref:ImuA family protein n=1 Tax=Mesorhizobium sp. TaxID=1871066 RepID=UPI000FE980DC|nr:ImuA family protein [Mesorhizobium sp.]RWH69582.1 MAG: damage-inducible protein [Mesorhizobium sp.]RWH76035.1 MAG: damage-inducible protein [Mesorhizobium sp.]RWH83413.1 MAG: damage-inducible protein [Mesorhizobium sp.]RWH91316.1 MAG: damage-inducible protein [Mesorhizobium sp.]RWI04727.1 MAG: damage-inducible protein [Mesorhizobium sp.]